MNESMGDWKRSAMCGELTEENIGGEYTLMGWCHKQRDLGSLIFITLRDISGEIQIVCDATTPSTVTAKAFTVRSEFVVAVKGKLRMRSSVNKEMKTGTIELVATDLRILSEAKTTPFYIEENVDVNESLRLEYRYLDLRRPDMQRKLLKRHRLVKLTRDFFDAEGFIDVETPMLIKSTPEGARDYLVPSRIFNGKFFALPQSPQLYKQLLMLAGYNKYMQIARCFRDEALRADRQPEFTQIDMEMSFVSEDDVMDVNERYLAYIMKKFKNVDIKLPIARITWRDAMSRYGSDKPDMRFGMEIYDASAEAADTEFAVFKNILAQNGRIAYIAAAGAEKMSRRELDHLTDYLKHASEAKGLAYVTLADGTPRGSLAKYVTSEWVEKLRQKAGVTGDAMLFFVSDADYLVCQEALGVLRLEVARKLNMIPENEYNFCWVTEFPLLEFDKEENRFVAMHHPFTSPMEEDLPLLDTDPGKVRARAYDIVLNGTEIGGGSIRIHRQDLQKKMFNVLGFSDEDAEARFGFLLKAFAYGVPPHGGLAYGLDRLAMLLMGEESIREVIAFPKVQNSSCLMVKAPDYVSAEQLEELGIAVVNPQDK